MSEKLVFVVDECDMPETLGGFAVGKQKLVQGRLSSYLETESFSHESTKNN